MGDDSYKQQPKFMSNEIVEAMLLRINNHCKEHNILRFLIVFHGGEPLLVGKDFYKNFVKSANLIISKDIEISYTMQSNGILLDVSWCKLLKKLNIQVGVSLDGTPTSNEQNRVYHNGKGSYAEILNGFKNVKSIFGRKFSNCLCVIDTNQQPNDVYNHFKSIGVNSVSFLFQDFNYITSKQSSVPQVGKWLIKLFDIWYNDKEEIKPTLKPFDELVGLILGKNVGSESFGKGFNDTIVIETDGAIETVDTLRICGNGFTKTKFNVLNDEFNELFKESKLARLYYKAHLELPEICQSCTIQNICGGGYLGHRYSPDNDFDNPTIYCKEIIHLVAYMQNKILDNLPITLVDKLELTYLNAEEILESLYE